MGGIYESSQTNGFFYFLNNSMRKIVGESDLVIQWLLKLWSEMKCSSKQKRACQWFMVVSENAFGARSWLSLKTRRRRHDDEIQINHLLVMFAGCFCRHNHQKEAPHWRYCCHDNRSCSNNIYKIKGKKRKIYKLDDKKAVMVSIGRNAFFQWIFQVCNVFPFFHRFVREFSPSKF